MVSSARNRANQFLFKLIILMTAACDVVIGQVLTPPYFNLAVGRRITASATCGVGVSENELYCKLVGANTDKQDNPNINLIQGQVCDYCNPNVDEMAHPPQYAIDGTERWWQSPPLSRGNQYNEVNLTIDLGQEFHVAYVFIKMANSPRPGVWALERSIDDGKTYKPWQYFADTPSDCYNMFGTKVIETISEDDSAICETKFSKVVPLAGGEMVVSLLNDRPSANNFSYSTVLQEWTKATNIRLRFLRTKTLLGHLMSVARQDPTVTRRYFYSVKDISIGGRCVCNGHAATCDITDPRDPYKLLCRCQHDTCGAQCETCCPGFVQKKWQRATAFSQNECEPCNCYGHSTECRYDEEVDKNLQSTDIHGNKAGGGVCLNCQHNTQGVNCEQCVPGYYRPAGRQLNDTNACEPCDCNYFYSTGSCAPSTGNCECRDEFLPPDCDVCNFGYYGYPDCKPCDCNQNGTYGNICEVGGGQCPCKKNYEGLYCDKCKEGYYGFPECLPCECNSVGSMDELCNITNGQCECRANYGGRDCGQCAVGWFNYPNCEFCKCDTSGTTSEVCNNQTGECLCKEGYGGVRCDQCAASYYGYPNCIECGCNERGSSSLNCDNGGQCRCLSNFAGKKCNRCSPGYYNYPECKPCGCDMTGSIGISCNNEGTCTCKNNFDGLKCNSCKEGFYNYPLCEECNCDPAGIISTFGGCGSLTDGLLCECKERVTGRICNKCKPLFWNLKTSNELGCEDCDCHLPGTIGGLQVCDGVGGQCMCKSNVDSRRCDTCKDGTFQLTEENLFGCIDCGCNVGGSVSANCDKTTGQCPCRPRVSGLTCNEPLQLHYFPTLYQHQYELEDGRTPVGTAVRYSYDEKVFPNFSWKGYAVFSQLQNEVLLDVVVSKPSLYQVILRYVSVETVASKGEIRLIPETSGDTAQSASVLLNPSRDPKSIPVTGPDGTPVPFVLNPGRWTVSVSADKLFIDYLVLLPSAFYEATLLQEDINAPCEINTGNGRPCRQFTYPGTEGYSLVRGDSGYYTDDDYNRINTHVYLNETVTEKLDSGNMALMDKNQSYLEMDLNLSNKGRYVLLTLYYTPTVRQGANSTVNIMVGVVKSENETDSGQIILYQCKYNMLCRQAVSDVDGRVAVYDFDSTTIGIKLNMTGDADAAIHSIVAIPEDEWRQDFMTPKSMCIRIDGRCQNATSYELVPNSIKVEFESGEIRQVSKERPTEVYDEKVGLIHLDSNETTVDIRGTVPTEGDYIFVVHYYQPRYPEFNVDVLIQNGQFYEASLPVRFCPSNTGCRSVIRKKGDDGTNFKILENFLLTLNNNRDKSVWVDYVLVLPASEFNEDVLKEKAEDRAGRFIKDCSHDNFRVSTNTSGFCRDSTFSLTSDYNNGALPCACNRDGSLSFECEKFGGQCRCKPNVIGRTCSECQTGSYGFPVCEPCNCPSTAICQPITGQCLCPPRVTGARCNTCKPLTYGFDPIIGCEECNCNPVGVKKGDLQCDLDNGKCICKPNVIGRQCDRCLAGYWAFPYCQLCRCDLRGTTPDICDQENSRCYCKANVYGPACDKCRRGTFYLEERNPAGCTKCFCFGTTDRCSSALMYIVQVTDYNGWNGTALNVDAGSLRIVEDLNITVDVSGDTVRGDLPPQMPEGTFFYVVAPSAYHGNRVTSYGGMLRYSVAYVIDDTVPGGSVIGPDVILVGNNMTIMHEHLEQPAANQLFEASIPLLELEFTHLTGSPVSREQFMVILAGLEAIYIRGLYYQPTQEVRISRIMLDIADQGPIADAPQALSVESCQCPPNYRGSSCEECAPGYYRSKTGPHLGYCVPCQCNGHADTCDVDTGKCINCKHNTTGDNCESCVGGYHGEATQGTPYDCLICACPLPFESNNFATSCEVSPSGLEISCQCKDGYYGPRCDVCSAGYFGRPDIFGGKCELCNCNENIDRSNRGSCDSQTGNCLLCLNNTSGAACNLCAAGYFGDAVYDKDCKKCPCDDCGTAVCNNTMGTCDCHPNVIGERCDKCSPEHWGLRSCLGCRPCNCGAASYEVQCDSEIGQCRCKSGVTGLRCDICEPGYWNYNKDGCQHCNCDEIYSAGAVCNPVTGQCQCLPGVIGDKCDRCPWRWVLITNQGCQKCGPCIHSLLDETDNIANMLDPALAELEGASSSFFAYKRLDNVNETIVEIRPSIEDLVGDVNKMDLAPTRNNVESLELYGEDADLKSTIGMEKAGEIADDANKAKLNSLETEQLLLEAIRKSHQIIVNIKALASGLEDEAISADVDKSIFEAERILAEITGRNLSVKTERSLNESELSAELHGQVKQFQQPSLSNDNKAKELIMKLSQVEEILDDALKNKTASAVEQTDQTVSINSDNKRAVAVVSNKDTTKLTESTNEYIKLGESTNADANGMLINATSDYTYLNETDEQLAKESFKLKDFIVNMKNQLNETEDLVVNASLHSDGLTSQVYILERLLDANQNTSKSAVKAATAYRNIKTAILESEAEVNVAVNVSMRTQNMSGISERTNVSRILSATLLDQAQNSTSKVKGDLSGSLSDAKQAADALNEANSKSKSGMEMLKTQLKAIPERTLDDSKAAVIMSSDANMKATDANEKLQIIVNDLPSKVNSSEEVIVNVEEANDGIKRVETIVNRASGQAPELVQQANRVADKVTSMKRIGNDMGDKIAELRRKVALARDKAGRIEIGVKFKGSTNIQLRNPEDLQEAATYTQMAMYFKTTQPDGLLSYIGNEVGTHKRTKRMSTDDYMALEVRGGRVLFTIDLGNGPKTAISDKYVADGQWHKVIVERTGNSAKLTVQTEDESDDEVEIVLGGTNIVFNLDQELSKFFVGGIPSDIDVQNSILNSNFQGEIEKLEFGERFHGFWNFEKGIGNDEGSKERDKLVILEKSNGMKFDGTGYAIMQTGNQDLKQQTNVMMDFKSYAKDGLLFLVGPTDTRVKRQSATKSFFSLELKDGHVQLLLSLGKDVSKIMSPKRYNDGEWHTIDVARIGRETVLRVDRREVASGVADGAVTDLDVTDKMYIAGFPGDHDYSDVQTTSYEGCIKETFINAVLLDLNQNHESLGAISGCPATIARTVSFAEGQTGYVAMPSKNIENFLQVSFKFKTLRPDALLFYSANEDQLSSFAISLVDGAIVVRSRPGGEIKTKSDAQYNDALWHYVLVTKANRKLRIDVDDSTFVEKILTEEPEVVTTSPLYFGGVPDSYSLGASSVPSSEPFIGCLGDTTVNSEFQNFADTVDRPGASLASCALSTRDSNVSKEINVTTTPAKPTTTSSPEESTDPVNTTVVTTASSVESTTAEELNTTTEEPTTTVMVTTEMTTTEEPETTSMIATTESKPVEVTTTTDEIPSKEKCGLPLIPLDDDDIAEDAGYRLGNKPDSRLEYDYVQRNIREVSKFSMQFKTSASSGVLFYVADSRQIDFIGLFMKDGKVHYTFNCGSGAALLTSAKAYNDTKWHTATFSRNKRDGKLVIDGTDSATGTSSGQAKWINIKAPFFFGGLSDDMMRKETRSNLKGTINVFDGCVRDFKQGIYSLERPSREISVGNCSDKVESGSFFSADGGHIKMFDKFRVGFDLDITIDIKPRSISGVILANHGKRDFLVLQMLDGNVKFSVDNGAGPITVTYFSSNRHSLCDGQWHRLQAVKTKNVVTLSVDGMFVEPGLGVAGISSTDTNDPLYLGGIPDGDLPRGVETNEQFVGCIANVEFDSKIQTLLKATVRGGVTLHTCPTI